MAETIAWLLIRAEIAESVDESECESESFTQSWSVLHLMACSNSKVRNVRQSSNCVGRALEMVMSRKWLRSASVGLMADGGGRGWTCRIGRGTEDVMVKREGRLKRGVAETHEQQSGRAALKKGI